MVSNMMGDGNFDFPDYPLSGGQRMSDKATLMLDSKPSSVRYNQPWAVANGFVTVCGETPHKPADSTWPVGSNAVLLGSLAQGEARGTLSQNVDTGAIPTLLLSFYSRVSIADPRDTSPCPSATLDVLLDGNPFKSVSCLPEWTQTSMVVPASAGKVGIGFKDNTPSPPKVDCVAAVAGVTLVAYTVVRLEKDAGDKQFAYLNEAFSEQLTVHPVDSLGRTVNGIPVTFEVTAGNVGLTASHVNQTIVTGDVHNGKASVAVYGSGRGAAKVTVSAPGVTPVTFDLFVGPLRGDVELSCSPNVITVRPVRGSETATVTVKSRSDSTPLLYFPLAKAKLAGPYSFDNTNAIPDKVPLGKTEGPSGTFRVPTIYLKGTGTTDGTLTIEYDGVTSPFSVIYRH